MNILSWREWLYSAKAFTAAMLALYIALVLDLPNPYWCVLSVYVVSHPLSGATRSKAIYRAVGTLIGATGALVIVPLFVDSPLLLSAVAATWVSALLYLALLDRTPRGYIFMLAAYTLPIVALPTVTQPQHIWDIALARSEEIILGISCAAVVSTVIYPRRMGPVIAERMRSLLGDAAQWSQMLLKPGRESEKQVQALRHRLIGDLAALDALIRQMAHDASTRTQVEHAQQLRLRMIMLIPHASALNDPIEALRARRTPLAAPVIALMHETLDWMQPGALATCEPPAQLRERIRRQRADYAGGESDRILARNALRRLEEIVDLWQDSLALHHAYAGAGTMGQRLRYRHAQLSENVLYYDHPMLAWNALSAGLFTFVGCVLWIALGWNYGAGGVVLGAVGACFFAALDDPRPQLASFLALIVAGTGVALIYLFLILPHMQAYWGLVAVLAPPFLLAAPLINIPRYSMAAVLVPALTISNIGLRETYTGDFSHFANASLSPIFGLILVIVWTNVTKPFGSELIARRLARSSWSDLAELARSRVRGDQTRVTSRVLDRSCQLLPRVVALRDERMAHLDVVRDLRIALRLLDIEGLRNDLSVDAAKALDGVLDGVGDYFLACRDARRALPPPAVLRTRLDDTIDALTEVPDARYDHVAQALTGLRLALFRPRPAPPITDVPGARLAPAD